MLELEHSAQRCKLLRVSSSCMRLLFGFCKPSYSTHELGKRVR